MAAHDLSLFRHSHAYDPGNPGAEKRTWVVVAITAIVMVVEIVAGMVTGSMALLADGWHMATHVIALGIAGIAYLLARQWSKDERFAFGTWKIEVLGAFSSALLLAVVAIAMIVESVLHLITPEAIAFAPALGIAVLGLVVNLASALVLGAGHDHHHGHDHGHGHHEHGHEDHAHHDHHGHDHAHHEHHEHADEKHHDLNLRSAYVHVLADAVTSVLAIIALAAGLWLGIGWLDPVMGLVGAGVVAWWSVGLIGQSSRILLDREMDAPLVEKIRAAVETDGDAVIADLHVWRVGRASHAAVLTVVADNPQPPAVYRERLACVPTLMHVSVEVNRCPQGDCP
ncbi:MAG TPA: CDF family Co(II)/Ni(II) efflux transporter DmeF [Usitatibacter sp.]|nr:CDF family Co(II)/Ni(II) efflux transporter DmeF [Usitatibacter sp.]